MRSIHARRLDLIKQAILERGVYYYDSGFAEVIKDQHLEFLQRYQVWSALPVSEEKRKRPSIERWWKESYPTEHYPKRLADLVLQYLDDLTLIGDDRVKKINRQIKWEINFREFQEEEWRRKVGFRDSDKPTPREWTVELRPK